MCISCQFGLSAGCSFPVKVDERKEMEAEHGHRWRSRYEDGCRKCQQMQRLGLWPESDAKNAPINIWSGA